MGVERVLQVATRLTLATIALSAVASAAPTELTEPRERVAIIDVGPADSGQARQKIAAALVAGDLAPLSGDGVDLALAGVDVPLDAAGLAAALADAQTAFGALDCGGTIMAAKQAIGYAAARQAGGLPAMELSRAWTYVLLCADRNGDAHGALAAATQLRSAATQTGLTAQQLRDLVSDDLLAKYPEVDALLDRELFTLEITADVPGAAIWIDFVRVGTSPVKVQLRAGEHVIAASVGDRRGFAMGTAVATQTSLAVPTLAQRGQFGAIAKRVASWGSETPAASEVGFILDATRTRVAIVRRGDALEVWGRAGKGEPPYRLGVDDGSATLDDAPRLATLITDRVTSWNEHAPDPDRPLLVEDPRTATKKKSQREDEPTKWWVYATVIGAALAGGVYLYAAETSDTTQHLELHVP